MTDVAKLYELQKTDSNWEKVKRRLLQLQKLLGETEEVKAARDQLAKAEADYHHWQAAQKNAELESQSIANKIKSSEERLMSGQMRNPKELDALQTSVAALKRQRAESDGAGVEAMIKVDETKAALGVTQKALAQVEAKAGERQRELIEDENKYKRLFVQLKTHRAKLTSSLVAADLEMYEDMRRRKAGVAVATVEKSQCSGCNMQVPTGIASNARNPAQLTHCPSCGRILYSGS